jgi:hypothetical protein
MIVLRRRIPPGRRRHAARKGHQPSGSRDETPPRRTTMLEFMRLGGMPMWVMLICAIGAAAVAAARGPARRSDVLAAGSLLVLIEGVAGMASGMKAVAGAVPTFTGDKGAIVAEGLGELANDGLLGAGLALALGVAALVTRRPPSAA